MGFIDQPEPVRSPAIVAPMDACSIRERTRCSLARSAAAGCSRSTKLPLRRLQA
jgi:hypothetical protein